MALTNFQSATRLFGATKRAALSVNLSIVKRHQMSSMMMTKGKALKQTGNKVVHYVQSFDMHNGKQQYKSINKNQLILGGDTVFCMISNASRNFSTKSDNDSYYTYKQDNTNKNDDSDSRSQHNDNRLPEISITFDNEKVDKNGKNKKSETLEKELLTNLPLQSFMIETYKYTGGGIIATLGTAQVFSLLMTDELMSMCSIPMLTTGFLGGLGCLYMLIKPIAHGRYNDLDSYKYSRLSWFAAFAIAQGIQLTPFIYYFNNMIDPSILPIATGITAAIFGSASLYAYKLPSNALLPIGTSLFAGLITLVGVHLTAIFGASLFGLSNETIEMLSSMDVYGGIGLFSMLVAYDTQKAVESFKKGKSDAIMCAVELHLDFINLLVRIMEVLAKNKYKH